jgi:hypothetical protein
LQAEEAENDPVLKAQRKAEIVERARKRDAALAASLLGVDINDVDYVPPTTDRDDGSDIAGGGEVMTEKERQEVRAVGLGVEDVDWTDDVSVDKLASSIIKKAVEMPVSTACSHCPASCVADDLHILGHLMSPQWP